MRQQLLRLLRKFRLLLFGHRCEECGTTLLPCGAGRPDLFYCLACEDEKEVEP